MHLFFYGVLLGQVAQGPVRDLLVGLGSGRTATTGGRLYAVPDPRGWYPVLVPGEGRVRGMVHAAGAVDLAALDRFEGVDPADAAAGEYRRKEVAVCCEGGEALRALAYLYNRPVTPELVAIPHGDFARWLRETGASVFAGG